MKTVLPVLLLMIASLTLPRVAVASDFISEVVTVKNARASDITEALNHPDAGPAGASRIQRLVQRAASSGTVENTGQHKVIADERSNSLLIFATRDEMEKLKRIVSKLDVPVRQILIDAVILEVHPQESRDFPGMQPKEPLIGSELALLNGGLPANITVRSRDSFVSRITANNPVVPPVAFQTVDRLGEDLDWLRNELIPDKQVRILQSLRLPASRTTPARFGLLQTDRFLSDSDLADLTRGGPHCVPQFEINLGLEVTPWIDDEGLVVMQLHQSIGAIVGSTEIPGVGNVPDTALIESEVRTAVRDCETIMLSGVVSAVRHVRDSSTNRVPSQVFILLRPTLLPDPAGSIQQQGN